MSSRSEFYPAAAFLGGGSKINAMLEMMFFVAYSAPVFGTQTAMFCGYARSVERFRELCSLEGFDLEGLEVVVQNTRPRDELGRPFYREGVHLDLGMI